MGPTATQPQLTYAAEWLSARGVEFGEDHGYWYFGELPDAVRIVLDANYADGNEATFSTRDEAVNALAITLAECLDGAGLHK
jgi:hypothetical protein